VVTAVSAVLRGLYLCRTTTVFGDAVNYAWVARGIATGRGAEVDTFWSSLYCFWEAGFHAFGLAPTTAAISASFLPGVLLAGAVTWLARNLYGSTVAWIAGLLCCVHPRLVEYACNGYAESFYLLAFTLGVGCLTRIIQQPSLVLAIGWGIGFGLYASVRNEGLLAFAASLLLLPAAGVARGWRPRLRGAWLPAAASVAGFACVVTTYAGLSRATVGTCGVFQKGANLGKQFSEQLDAHAAARETYGGTGTMFGRPAARPRLLDEAAVLARRYPANLYYTLQRLPGVLLSPLPLFALLLPMVARHRGRAPGDERPLALMLAFPLAFYPCIQVEPRLLMPVLVPLHVFGAAGLVAIAAYLFPEPRGARVIRTATLAMLAVACLLTAWRAGQVERTYGFHRNLAGFLASHVAPGEPIVGCGYGNVTTTAFLAGRPAVPRLWTDHPEELARFVAARRSHWLVLYEPFLRDANPELLGALDHGVPGFERACEVRDAQGRRSQIFRLKEKT
jgi:4-amino-4-deoxy-L-arabinose transferase-like glycosyltransferase